MYTFEQKRKEVVYALADLRRKLPNRRLTGRRSARMEERCRIMDEIIKDYERAIARSATQEPVQSVQSGPSAQYLLSLEQRSRPVPGAGNGNPDEEDT